MGLEAHFGLPRVAEVEQQVFAGEHVGVVEQRRVERVFYGFCDSVLAFAVAYGYDGCAAVAQGGVDVVEVEVDVAFVGDDFGDGACGRGERVVGFGECVLEYFVRVYVGEPLVVDDEQRVDVFAHFFGSGEGFVDFLESFEQERYGDDAYGEEPSLACYACHDGGGSCACASAHACGDEDHVDVGAEEVVDVGGAFFGCGACHFGLGSGSASACDGGAEQQFVGHGR